MNSFLLFIFIILNLILVIWNLLYYLKYANYSTISCIGTTVIIITLLLSFSQLTFFMLDYMNYMYIRCSVMSCSTIKPFLPITFSPDDLVSIWKTLYWVNFLNA